MTYQSTRHLKRLALMIHSMAALLSFSHCAHSIPSQSPAGCILPHSGHPGPGTDLFPDMSSPHWRFENFNKDKPLPDILEEKVHAYPSNITSETGFWTISSLEEIIEKQGDIIVYLKRHNALLSKRLLAFTSSDLGSHSSRMWEFKVKIAIAEGSRLIQDWPPDKLP